jgi:hypothetical protein
LEQDPHLLAERSQLAFRQLRDLLSIDENFSAGRFEKADQMFQEHTFPPTGTPEDYARLTFRHVQVEPSQNMLLAQAFV